MSEKKRAMVKRSPDERRAILSLPQSLYFSVERVACEIPTHDSCAMN